MTDIDWRDSAVCRQVDPELWFPEKGGDGGVAAKRTCGVCPVRDECLDWAVTNWIHYGIWGGVSPETLQEIRKRRGMKPRNGGAMTPVPVDRIRELARLGWRAKAIANAVGCTERSVFRLLKMDRETGAAA